jgi:hypothetical protein
MLIVAVLRAVAMAAAFLVAAGTALPQTSKAVQPKRHPPPLTKFYDTPRPLPASRPGDLIRSQSFEQYELPLSVSAVRILYHSRSATGEDVAASGIVLTPYGKNSPAGGWPIIAWAHGASGVARACAPSLMRNVGHGPFLAMYVGLGYAVVATDYTGLGSDFRNAFSDGPSNATDLTASIPAARAAVPQLGARWILISEAEGNLAAVTVAEKENEIRDPGYLGSIVISGLAGAKELYERSPLGSSSLMLTSLAYGIKTVYPQFQLADMLTEKGLALYQQIEQNCWEAGTGAELSSSDTVKAGWGDDPFVRQYLARNSLAQVRAHGPIMVITSDADQSIPATLTAQTIARMCKIGDSIQWQRYPNVDPGQVMGDSVRDQISWIESRFAGRPAARTCP